MIQDIAPHVYDNHYQEQAFSEDDLAVAAHSGDGGDKIALVQAGESWRFPTVREILSAARKAGQSPAIEGTYLFSIDGQRYFRMEYREENRPAEAGGETAGKPEQMHEAGKKNLGELVTDETFPEGSPGAGESVSWLTRRQIREIAPRHVAFAAVTALALDGWYRDNRFCSRCGKALVRDHAERMLKCPDCGNMVYPRINPAVIVGVTKGDSLLMTKYAGRNYTRYALVAGFTEIGETVEETVIREVKEETGLDVTNVRYYKSQPWPFTDTLLMGFYCDAVPDESIHMDDGELAVAEWVARERIDEVQENYDDVSLTSEMIKYFRDNPKAFAREEKE